MDQLDHTNLHRRVSIELSLEISDEFFVEEPINHVVA
jgi:hypothetical protein